LHPAGHALHSQDFRPLFPETNFRQKTFVRQPFSTSMFPAAYHENDEALVQVLRTKYAFISDL